MNPYVILAGFVLAIATGLAALAMLRRAERTRPPEKLEPNPGLQVKRGQHVPGSDDEDVADYIARNW